MAAVCDDTSWCTRIAAAIASPTRYTGVSADSGSWNTIEMPAPRMRDISLSLRPSSSRPRKRTEPVTFAFVGSRPIAASEDTDLPEPDSPTIASVSPRRTW